MPWRRRYYTRRRRYWNKYWRPRTTFRRRRRRRYYRRFPVRRKKLKSIIVKEFQPKCIRKCKIKGSIPLYWGPPERFAHNYELYELSTAPEKIPSGGLFALKNFSLQALYAENQYIRNIWTHSNNNLPFVRYTGCKFKLYRSLHCDYIFSYDTALPLKANLDMYQSMHPAVHSLLHNKLIITRKKYNHQKRPYKTVHIKPPTPLLNKWYLQHDISSLPLVQLRASACSLDEWYINWRSISTTINIFYLKSTFQNYNFKNNPTSGYYCRIHNDEKIYLYTNQSDQPITDSTTWAQITFLGNTNDYQEGKKLQQASEASEFLKKNSKDTWGNPFHTKYLSKTWKVYYSKLTLATIHNYWNQTTDNSKKPIQNLTETELTDAIRYNPFNDQGTKNTVWLQSVKTDSTQLTPPENPVLKSSFLPLWLLLHGFEDFQKKNHTVTGIETETMIIAQTNFRNPGVIDTLPIIDIKFIQGKSPYEDTLNNLDKNRWYPCVQMQQSSIYNITSSGPGSPKVPPLNSIEAKVDYTFYFKFGGNPPPMDTLTDPSKQPEIHIPTNLLRTTSLQNPATRPEQYLYTFDQRRDYITTKAIKRLQKTWDIEKYSVTDGSHLSAKIQTPETTSSSEETSEEEEETQNLLLKLRKQQLRNKRLKLRILKNMGIIQK
nr:MAG: ORF1 [TTV-like mini virus]